MRRALAIFVGLFVALLLVASDAGTAAMAQQQPRVRLARATWDTGWFQAEVYRLLLERVGYRVDGPVTMDNADFYSAVAVGDVDLWANGWFPAHDVFIAPDAPVTKVGTTVDDGALQGYFIDAATAQAHGISNLAQLADPQIAALFDRDDDGRAELIGCDAGWSCAATIDHHLRAYGLSETVEQVQGDYSPLIAETIDLYEAGKPVLYYTWTPNWTVGALVPGVDVVWLETPFPSLPEDQSAALDATSIAGIKGCANDPCEVGWPPNDIRVVANSDFLDANPAVRRLAEQVVIPLEDISAQNVRMVSQGGDPEDIRMHAQEWVDANAAAVRMWIETASPGAVTYEGASVDGASDGGTLRVVARALPPFVIYADRAYSGFEVELVHLVAARLGMSVEIDAVDTVAKQIDDIDRGVADVGIGGTAITQSREQIVDFSLPVLDSGLTVMTTTQRSHGFGQRIQSFLRAIWSSDLPWLLVVFGIAVLLAAHLIWWLERRQNPDFGERYRHGIWDSLYWSVVTMSTVGYGDKVARGSPGRVVALVWIALGTLVFASFTASIASSLAVSELRGDIAGPSDLPGHQVATVEDSAGHAYLPSIGVGPVVVEDIGDAYALLDQGEVDAIVFDAPVLHFRVAHEGAGRFSIVGPDFDKVQYGFMLSEADAELREQLNIALLEMNENGVYRQLHDRWFGADN